MKKLWLAAVMTGVTALLTMAADDPRVPTAETIRADVLARGGAQADDFDRSSVGGLVSGDQCYGGEVVTRVPLGTLPPAPSHVADEALLCPGLGTYWIARHDTRFMGAQTIYAYAGPYPMHELAGKFALAKRMREEVDTHADEFLPAGSNEPTPGPAGELPPALEDGGILVALRVPPRDGADMFTEVAIVEPHMGLYWARRTGGFAGVDTWIGPFSVPVLTDAAPTAVRPRRVRSRKRVRRVNITIRREMTGDADARVRRRDYLPTDIQLGAGVEVLRVLRADRRRIRVRVRVSKDAVKGDRGVRVKGAYAAGLFRIG